MKNYISVEYDEESHPYTEYPKQLCRYLYRLLEMQPGMKMLESGCGRGESLSNFQKLGLDVYGVDVSPEAKEYSKDLIIETCDVEKDPLPFKNDTFDIIYSKSFIEHLYNPGKYFEEAYRVLKPSGFLFTLVPDWSSQYKTYFDDHTHRSPFTKISLDNAYKMYGFERVTTHHFRQLPIVWKHPSMNYLCNFITPFIPVTTKNKFLRWSRELMVAGIGFKPKES